jgi:DNA (cytosine-5)-methyltransferase 1
MTHGSLFSGIGGFDLAAEWMGWENVFHCEWNPFGQKVLKHYWPNAISYEDITKTDFTIHRGEINIISGGFPCQPYSTSGQRLGKEDDRHLWPEMLRAIREIQPSWVVGENVRGLTNWNGGLVFDEVQSDLETEGYEVLPFLLPACAINAPHRRDRIFFIANSNRNGLEYRNKANNLSAEENKTSKKRSEFTNDFTTNGSGFNTEWDTNLSFENIVCRKDDGISNRLDSITFSKWRKESIKAYGNSVVPQLILQIFKAIDEYEKINS